MSGCAVEASEEETRERRYVSVMFIVGTVRHVVHDYQGPMDAKCVQQLIP